ncbi:MAG TPA: LPD29 domain-containing protein, partial [Streptomyces sp.]|nr:LPD29 domain-containing protein [Streptomyces sp.]
MTEYIDTKYVSAELKRRILQKFPGIEKLSVTTGTGTASAWISVRWTDGPSVDAVEKLTGPMHGARWNGMTDSYDRVDSTVTVTIKGRGRVTGKPLVDGINCHREVSADALAEARRLWSEHFDGADPATAGRKEAFSVRGRLIHDNWADIQVRQIAETVVLPERWAALQAEREKTQKQQKTDAGAAPSGEGIVISHTEKDGTTVTGTRRGDGAAEILKDHKLRWYGKGGFWYIPRSRGQQADAARI